MPCGSPSAVRAATFSIVPPLVIAIFAGFVVLAIVGGIFAARAARRRRDALAALAAELGIAFAERADYGHGKRYPQFGIFQRGSDRYAYNTLSGTIDLFGDQLGGPCELVCGDFHYEEESGSGDDRSTTNYDFSYLIVHPPWSTPSLLIRREGFFDKLKGALGFEDIDFESEEFSRTFYVSSSDKRFAYDVLHPRMMEFLLAERPPTLTLADDALCVSDGGSSRTWSPETFHRQLAFLRKFCELWPRHLVKDLNT